MGTHKKDQDNKLSLKNIKWLYLKSVTNLITNTKTCYIRFTVGKKLWDFNAFSILFSNFLLVYYFQSFFRVVGTLFKRVFK